MKNQVEVKEVIIITNELGKEVFTREGELIASMPRTVVSEMGFKGVDMTTIDPIENKNISVDRNTYSVRIMDILKNHDFMLKDLSELTGISRSVLSNLKNRKQKMSRSTAIKMQQAGLGDAKSWLELKV